MWIGWIELDVLLGDVHSLKEKRSVVRPVLAELKRRFDVSVTEAEYHDQYRRTVIGAGLVAADRAHLVDVLAAVRVPWPSLRGEGAGGGWAHAARVPWPSLRGEGGGGD